MNNYKYGIVCAMPEETLKIVDTYNLKPVKTYYDLKLYNNDNIILIQSGIGKTASAFATMKLLSMFSPSHIINIGLCGAVDNNLSIGDTFLIDDVYQADAYIPFEVENFMQHINVNLFGEGRVHKTKSLATVDRFVNEINDSLGFNINADLVDMEGYSVAYVCRENMTPYTLIKSVSDFCNKESDTELFDNLTIAMNNGLSLLKQIINET